MNNKLYHGTVWERPLLPTEDFLEKSIVFDKLNTGMNELNAFFACQNEKICEFFSGLKTFDEDNQCQAILELSIDSQVRKYEEEFRIGESVVFSGVPYDYSNNGDRMKLYKALRDDGYQAFVMKNDYDIDYGSTGDDIAILDTSVVRSTGVKLKPGEIWTPFMPIEQAKVVFKRWASDDEVDLDCGWEFDSAGMTP